MYFVQTCSTFLNFSVSVSFCFDFMIDPTSSSRVTIFSTPTSVSLSSYLNKTCSEDGYRKHFISWYLFELTTNIVRDIRSSSREEIVMFFFFTLCNNPLISYSPKIPVSFIFICIFKIYLIICNLPQKNHWVFVCKAQCQPSNLLEGKCICWLQIRI